jgi:carboxymethylenebutenolidase
VSLDYRDGQLDPIHAVHLMAQERPAAPPAAGGLAAKAPHLVASIWTAPSTVARTPLRHEWVNIPTGRETVRAWVQYPEGSGPAPVVLVMQHGPGLDDWMRAAADQLAREGFIAVAPDLWSGLGPNGGGREAFRYPDEAIRAAAGKLTADDTLRRYRAAWDAALKLPRSNGRGGTIGFCAGGTWSFRFAGEVPDARAAVVFYGVAPDASIMARIKAPVLGLYGEDDARITDTVAPTAAAMTKLGKTYETHVYPGATHAFLEYQAEGRNGAATADAWPRATAFLRRHLN